jgi:hypothetical protein
MLVDMLDHRRAAKLSLLALAFVATACSGPTPSPAVSGPIATPVANATLVPTATPVASATPVPSLAAGGVELFQPLEHGHWVIVSSQDNLAGITQSAVLLPAGDTVEVHTVCAGAGRVHVRVSASLPATATIGPGETPFILIESDVECPQAGGESMILAGTVEPGSFISVDAAPSDPSIRYQVLVGTIVD